MARVFFAHIMKTGGWSFHAAAIAALPIERVWAATEGSDARLRADDGVAAAMSVEGLAALPPERRSAYDLYSGHFPVAAASLAGEPVLVATILRHPVERTLSYLGQCERKNPEHRGLPLEEIYEDEWFFPRFVENHQTKVVAMTVEEMMTPSPAPEIPEWFTPEVLAEIATTTAFVFACTDPPVGRVIPLDRSRLEDAKRRLGTIDVLGVQEDHEAFVQEIAAQTGWALATGVRANVGRPVHASAGFRRRIADDNALDLELYEHALELLAERRR